ncbi:MAG: NACHT domain-containing protein, partial [Waterburya sp.]
MTGIELFAEPVATVLVQTIIELAKTLHGDFSQSLSNDKKVAAALKTYINKYQNRYGLIRLLGMTQSIKLESIYTPIKFLDSLSIRRFDSINDLEASYRQGGKRSFEIGRRTDEDGIIVANNNQYLMVLAGPGAGKSTFLRRVGLEALKGERGKFEHRCIPVMLELKRFDKPQVNLIEAIAQEFSHFGFPPSTEFVVKALETGKLLVLFDGLDEVPKEQFHKVIDSIDAMVAQYEHNRFIASCRIAAYRRGSCLQNFKDIEVAEFDERQIRQFIDNWFQSK